MSTTQARPAPGQDRPKPVQDRMRAGVARLATVARYLAQPTLRIALALPFLRSGFTRWDGFLHLSPSTLYIFQNQFKLHIFGGAYSFPAPIVVAHLTGIAEILLPILLLVGFATRFTALGLLIMVGVIQLVFPDGWANFHLYWAAIAVAIIALGAGPLSLDRLLFHRYRLDKKS